MLYIAAQLALHHCDVLGKGVFMLASVSVIHLQILSM